MNRDNGIYWIMLGVLGIFLIIAHNFALEIVCKVIGIGMIVSAAYGLADYYKYRDNSKRLAGSIICLLAGIWIFGSTGQFITFINVFLGLILIISGAAGFYSKWTMGIRNATLIFSCITILFGIVIACNNAATSWVTIGAGIGLVYSAVTGYLGSRRER